MAVTGSIKTKFRKRNESSGDNPYFQRREIREDEQHWESWKIRGIIGIAVVLVVYAVWFSGMLSVSEIVITGNENISNRRLTEVVENSLSETWLGFLPQDNILFHKPGNLKTALNNEFLLKELHIQKGFFPNTLSIELKERLPGLSLQHKDQEWVTDDEGVVLGAKDQLSPGVYPNVSYAETPNALSVDSGEEAITPELASMILSLFEDLPDSHNLHPETAIILPTRCDKDVPPPVEEREVIPEDNGLSEDEELEEGDSPLLNTNTSNENDEEDKSPPLPTFTLQELQQERIDEELIICETQNLSRDAQLVLGEGYSILFTTHFPLEQQLSYLTTFLESDAATNTSALSSIDLRYGNKIYYY